MNTKKHHNNNNDCLCIYPYQFVRVRIIYYMLYACYNINNREERYIVYALRTFIIWFRKIVMKQREWNRLYRKRAAANMECCCRCIKFFLFFVQRIVGKHSHSHRKGNERLTSIVWEIHRTCIQCLHTRTRIRLDSPRSILCSWHNTFNSSMQREHSPKFGCVYPIHWARMQRTHTHIVSGSTVS